MHIPKKANFLKNLEVKRFTQKQSTLNNNKSGNGANVSVKNDESSTWKNLLKKLETCKRLELDDET